MPTVVKRPFKAASDIVASAKSHRSHRLGRSQAPASRTTNEEEVVPQIHPQRLQFPRQTLRKSRVHGLIGKGLPLYKDSPFADRPEIWNSYIGPLSARAHVNELRSRI
jgi:hypothetical protein